MGMEGFRGKAGSLGQSAHNYSHLEIHKPLTPKIQDHGKADPDRGEAMELGQMGKPGSTARG